MTQQEFFKRYSYSATDDLLGSGGFGKVFRAWDSAEECEVALKIQPVNPQYPSLRLSKEVETAAKLRHSNVARYKECYTFTDFGGETDIAVMSYYKDGSLDKLMKAQALTYEQRVDILTQILEGIAYLHNNDIIHRDLKPQNILILRSKGHYVPKITDFGISKHLTDEEKSVVTNSILVGTRHYASPEQLMERAIHKNTDLWSFGVIAYQMLTGSLPFNSGTFSPTSEEGRAEQYRQMQSGVLPDSIGGIAEPWQALIRRCLVSDCKSRIASAEECLSVVGSATIIDNVEVDEPVDVILDNGNGGTPSNNTGGRPNTNVNEKVKKRGGWWIILLVLALLAGGGYAVVSLLDSGDEPVVEHSGVGDLLVVDHKQVFGSDGGDGTIVYALSDDGDVSKLRVKSGAEWVVIDNINEDVVEFHLLSNPHVDMRSSTITFSYGKQSFNVVVEQSGVAPETTMSASEMFNKGNDYYQSGNYTEAVKWCQKAAEQGYAKAQTGLGYLYAMGNGVKQSYSEAVYWYRKAADQGDVTAQFNLGVAYYNGNGVMQSYTEAVKWFRKAADQGDVEAQNRLRELGETW